MSFSFRCRENPRISELDDRHCNSSQEWQISQPPRSGLVQR